MSRKNVHRSVVRVMADGLFFPLVLIYALAAAAFGCSANISIGGSSENPNRAHGTFRTSQEFNESQSRIFFGYWLTGDNDISLADAQAFRDAVGTLRNTASVTIIPGSILYEEHATELGTGRTMTVSISGTWSYHGRTSMRVNWGSAFVTGSTFPTSPPFHVATSGTRINGPQHNDIIFSNSNWTTLRNVGPGPFNNVLHRFN